MTITSTTQKVSFTGNGSTTVFAYSFKIFATSDLQVVITSTAGIETTKTLGTHYNVSGAGSASGGNVTFTGGNTPASSELITISRQLTLTQIYDYVENDAFGAEDHEESLDRLLGIAQQLNENTNRTVRAPISDTGISMSLPAKAARASKIFAFDAAGNPETIQEVGTYRGDWAASTAYSLRDLVKDTATNNIFITTTAHTSSGSQPLTSNADSAKWTLIVDAASATTSAAASSTSASASSTSATASANSATASASSATGAASSASTASTQSSAASTSATAAAASDTSAASAVSAVGLQFTFDASTTMADPGTGDFRLNHGTIASVSAIALDATSADTGNPDVSDFITTWDDSTSTLNGHLILKKKGTPATFAIFTVGAVTDNTGWLQLALNHVDSNGSWSASDVGYLQFIRIGDKGDTGSTGATGATGSTGAAGSGNMDSFIMSDGSTTQEVEDGETQTFAAGEALDVAVSATNTVTFSAEDASTTNKGVAELATTAETVTGTDTGRVVTPAGLHGALAGLTDTTITAADAIIFSDATDSGNLKEDTVQGILDLAGGGGGFTSWQIFTASGTWTKPSGITKIRAIVVGAGGGGSDDTNGAGAGAGGTAIKVIDVSSISSETVTIGAGGTDASTGTAGGTTSLGSHCSATGGGGGTSSYGYAGAGGVGSSGDFNAKGGRGAVAYGQNYGGANGGTPALYGVHGGGAGYGQWLADTDAQFGGGGGGNGYGSSGLHGGDGLVIVEEYT